MTTDNTPQYACRLCGSDEIRGDFDSYAVYRAEGDSLVFLYSELTDPIATSLYCVRCGGRLELTQEELGNINFV